LKKNSSFDDELHISVWSMVVCSFLKTIFENVQSTGVDDDLPFLGKPEINVGSNYEKSLNAWKQYESKFKLLEKIQVLSSLKSKMSIPLVLKYLEMVNVFKMDDVKDCILPCQDIIQGILKEYGIIVLEEFFELKQTFTSLVFILARV
jgi:hypothetical protein